MKGAGREGERVRNTIDAVIIREGVISMYGGCEQEGGAPDAEGARVYGPRREGAELEGQLQGSKEAVANRQLRNPTDKDARQP